MVIPVPHRVQLRDKRMWDLGGDSLPLLHAALPKLHDPTLRHQGRHTGFKSFSQKMCHAYIILVTAVY